METSAKFTYLRPLYGPDKDLAATLGFQEEGNTWYLYRIRPFKDYHRQWLEDMGLQLYAPKGSLGYQFVLGALEQVDSLCQQRGISPLLTRASEYSRCRAHGQIYQIIQPRSMHWLMYFLSNEQEEVEFLTPAQHLLEKGDRVRVAGGEFAGLEGILLQGQGARDGGRVYVQLGENLGVATAKVPDEYIQVLEFAKGSNHFYYKHQAMEQQLTEALRTQREEGCLTSYQQTALRHFLFRYEYIGHLTYLNLARWMACKYAALCLLRERCKAEAVLADYYKWRNADKKARRSSLRTPAAQIYINDWVKRVDHIR